MRLKSYQILICIVLGSLLGGAILGGMGKVGVDLVLERWPSIAKHADYDAVARTYDFAKPFRHFIVGIALLSFIVLGRRLEIVSLAKLGLQRRAGWDRQLAAGVAIGIVSLAAVVGISFCCGARTVDPKFHLGRAATPLIGIALQAALIGLIEEILYRGFVLQSFLKDMRTWLAVVVTSVVFAALHFLDVKVVLPVGFDPLAGLRGLAILKGLVGSPAATMLPQLAGLALVGIVLSCAYVWTGSLYLSIGLHAGWVFSLKAARLLFERHPGVVPWFFGDGLVVTGVLGILSLIAVLGLLYLVWGRRAAPRPQEKDA